MKRKWKRASLTSLLKPSSCAIPEENQEIAAPQKNSRRYAAMQLNMP
jgi:hypothetical protein